jgi:hypothetical protein
LTLTSTEAPDSGEDSSTGTFDQAKAALATLLPKGQASGGESLQLAIVAIDQSGKLSVIPEEAVASFSEEPTEKASPLHPISKTQEMLRSTIDDLQAGISKIPRRSSLDEPRKTLFQAASGKLFSILKENNPNIEAKMKAFKEKHWEKLAIFESGKGWNDMKKRHFDENDSFQMDTNESGVTWVEFRNEATSLMEEIVDMTAEDMGLPKMAWGACGTVGLDSDIDRNMIWNSDPDHPVSVEDQGRFKFIMDLAYVELTGLSSGVSFDTETYIMHIAETDNSSIKSEEGLVQLEALAMRGICLQALDSTKGDPDAFDKRLQNEINVYSQNVTDITDKLGRDTHSKEIAQSEALTPDEKDKIESEIKDLQDEADKQISRITNKSAATKAIYRDIKSVGETVHMGSLKIMLQDQDIWNDSYNDDPAKLKEAGENFIKTNQSGESAYLDAEFCFVSPILAVLRKKISQLTQDAQGIKEQISTKEALGEGVSALKQELETAALDKVNLLSVAANFQPEGTKGIAEGKETLFDAKQGQISKKMRTENRRKRSAAILKSNFLGTEIAKAAYGMKFRKLTTSYQSTAPKATTPAGPASAFMEQSHQFAHVAFHSGKCTVGSLKKAGKYALRQHSNALKAIRLSSLPIDLPIRKDAKLYAEFAHNLEACKRKNVLPLMALKEMTYEALDSISTSFAQNTAAKLQVDNVLELLHPGGLYDITSDICAITGLEIIERLEENLGKILVDNGLATAPVNLDEIFVKEEGEEQKGISLGQIIRLAAKPNKSNEENATRAKENNYIFEEGNTRALRQMGVTTDAEADEFARASLAHLREVNSTLVQYDQIPTVSSDDIKAHSAMEVVQEALAASVN